ncbi:MAG: hypothetical protein CMF26_06095 [Kiloniella sp.]|nr:hypothetical protein [Kiloniella sp.]
MGGFVGKIVFLSAPDPHGRAGIRVLQLIVLGRNQLETCYFLQDFQLIFRHFQRGRPGDR